MGNAIQRKKKKRSFCHEEKLNSVPEETQVNNHHSPNHPIQKEDEIKELKNNSVFTGKAATVDRNKVNNTSEGPPYSLQFKKHDRVIVLYDFQAGSNREMSARRQDKLMIIGNENDTWVAVRNIETGQEGLIPNTYIALLESLDAKEWFFGNINRREAESLLQKKPDGTFLIRNSLSRPGNFALSLKHTNQDRSKFVRHYAINYTNYQYSIWARKSFSSLPELVEDYKENANGLPRKLQFPCPRAQPALHDLSVETKDEWEINREELKLFKPRIGYGNFGDVYRAKWNNQIEVAVKTLKIGSMPEQEFLEEATIMKHLKHENILGLLATCSKEEPVLIVTQYMSNGSLLKVLKEAKETESISIDQMLEFAFQISKGMAYLEGKNLVHRDLAARNVLVDGNFICKIADFGLAKLLGKSENVSTTGKIPVKWSPPEVFLEGRFSVKSDIWSFGVVIIEIFTFGDTLYEGMDQKTVKLEVAKGHRLPKPTLCPDYIYELLLKCWDHNPDGRPFFKSLKRHFDDTCHVVQDGTRYLDSSLYNC